MYSWSLHISRVPDLAMSQCGAVAGMPARGDMQRGKQTLVRVAHRAQVVVSGCLISYGFIGGGNNYFICHIQVYHPFE